MNLQVKQMNVRKQEQTKPKGVQKVKTETGNAQSKQYRLKLCGMQRVC